MRATRFQPSPWSGFRLRGIAAGLLVLLAGTACASTSYQRQRAEDERLAREVTESLRQRLPVLGRRVEARAHGGVVTLLGEASAAHSRLAQEAVEGLAGVARVNNLILVADSPAAAVAAAAEADSVLAARAQPAPAP
jgi:hypothetical protein